MPKMMTNPNSLTVAVLGASDQSDRFSFKAVHMLVDHGHSVFPVSPRKISLPPLTVYQSVADVPRPIHTITLYVNPARLETVLDEIIETRPVRVIFNPGTEHSEMEQRLQEAGIETLEACTLVLLSTGQFAA
jgi:predicted CoA-binding protein